MSTAATGFGTVGGRRSRDPVAPSHAAWPGLFFAALVFALWWHRPAMVDPMWAVATVALHTMITVLLLRGARRVGDPALGLLVVTVQALTALGFVLRMRVGVGDRISLGAYLVAVAVGVGLFHLGRSLAQTDRRREGPARNRWIRRNGRTGNALLILVVVSGVLALRAPIERGAQIGLTLGPLHVQPTEVFRFSLLGWIAFRLKAPPDAPRLFGSYRPPGAGRALIEYALVPAVVATALFVKLSDLGPAVVLFIGIVGLVVHLTGRWRYAAAATASFAVLAAVAMLLGVGVLGDRFALWKDPFYMGEHGSGRALQQPGKALLAYARGGLLGAGPGLGRVDSIGTERQNDFILAVLGEELGLVGTLLTGVLYALLLIQLFRLARRAGEESWLRAWLVGLSVMLAANIVWPALATTRVLPISGITTPLLSAGGTSMLVVLGIVGLAAGCAGPRPAASASATSAPVPGSVAPARGAVGAAGRHVTRAGRRSPLTWRAPALAGLLAIVTAGSLLNAQLVTAGAWLGDHDRSRGIARTERATFNRGRILSADGTVLAATVGSGVDATRHGTSTGLPIGDFRPSRKDTDGTGLENTWALQLECGTRPEEGLAGPRGLLGQRCQPADVRTSYNAEIQEAAVRALAEAKQAAPGSRGAVVALDPRTGGVLAIAADDDLATTVTGDASQPGSVFKIVTAAAIDPARLNAYHLAPHSSLPLPDGHSLRNFGGSICPDRDMVGIPALVDALRQSCNTAFAMVGKDIGPEGITRAAAAFGFSTPGPGPADKPSGQPADKPGGQHADKPGAGPGGQPADRSGAASACRALGLEPLGKHQCDLDGLSVDVSSVESGTADGERCLPEHLAIGQACVYATPLQMALVAAAVAAGGQLRPPHIVEQVERDATVLWKAPAVAPRPVIPPENAEMIRTGMVEAVNAGTAKGAAVPCAQVAAKTGTPETGPPSANPDTNAWTVAFAPAEEPEVVVAVYLKAPAGGHLTGGANAAPAAATTLRTALVALKRADRC
ncbi:hypothetical protein ACG83_04460 [Frankia sp. R43]|uniref:penicillin-binding transpeptidase domain-containing protein n=1 Tax=Frankia sp. R43 TaxID=269536 RepID=UPI0006C9EC63|nr:penicillin-binding transpeptidase domain-containing protein [Frankia sp. R43]KPM57051.1 hypothetical protein ACG83_04460 [Frankia sp. R43]